MATLNQDPRFSELLQWAELADQGTLNAEAQHLLQGVLGFVEEMIHRSEPQSSVVDRFSWTGTSFVDGLQGKYGAPEVSAIGSVLRDMGSNFDRLFQMSEIGFDAGYHFFDFESLVMPEVSWDIFEEDDAYDYAYTHASRKRSLFSKDQKAVPQKTMGRTRAYPKTMGASVNKVLPQILRNIPSKLGDTLRPEMVADWIDSSGLRGELVATPELSGLFDDTETSIGADGAFDAKPQTQTSGDIRTILSEAVLSNKGRANRIKDIRLQKNALPALNSALNAVRNVQQHQPQLAKESVTSTLRYHPVDMNQGGANRDLFQGTMLEIPAHPEQESGFMEKSAPMRPMITPQGFEPLAQSMQPNSLIMEDILLPTQAAPAMTAGLSEAFSQIGMDAPEMPAASNFSLAKSESMLQSVTLGVPTAQPTSAHAQFSADMTMVEQEEVYQGFEAIDLETIIKGHSSQSAPVKALPLEQEILQNRALGSQLAMTLGHSKPVAQAQETLQVEALNTVLQKSVAGPGPSALLKDVSAGMIRLPEEMVSRSELSSLSPDLLFQLVSQPEVAMALASGSGKDMSFWTGLQERGNSLNLSPTDVSEVWTLDAAMVDLPGEAFEEIEESGQDRLEAPKAPVQTLVSPSDKATAPAGTLTPTLLREVLSRAASKTGIRGNDLMPRMLKEVGARTEPKAIGSAFRKMLEANEISNLMGNANTAREFSTALRRELRSSGISDTTLLELPDVVAEAYPESAGDQSAPSMESTSATAAPAQASVQASKEQMQTVQMAARVAKRVGRAMRKLMTERFIGVPMPSIGWQDGPNLEALDGMVQRVLDMPLSETKPETSEAGQQRTYRDLIASGETGSGDFVQFSYNDAVEAGLMAEMDKGSKPSGAHAAPGISMGLSFSKVLSKPGEVSERLRTLLSAVETKPGSVLDLSAILGWNDREQVQSTNPDFDPFDDGGPAPSGGGWVKQDSMEPVRPPQPETQAESIPLGLTPSGTSMDLGRLSHTMLRPGEATSHDMNLVSPVSMAVAQSAHLKESSEQVGETARDKAEAGGGAGGSDGTKKEVPNEILELLSHQIAKRISTRMKFEQDRSGRWDF